MRILVAILASFLSSSAQCEGEDPTTIEINQTISQCEWKWFAADTTEGKRLLGFVYVDRAAGFTFEHYGSLELTDGKLRAVPSDLHGEARVIHRIGHNFPVACLSDEIVSALGLPIEPETMRHYKDDRPLGEHHASWAYHYNHIGASETVLEHVSKAKSSGYSSSSLTFEHAFALNALGRFPETVEVLSPLINEDSTADTIAELAFAFLNQGKFEEAIQLYEKAIRVKPISERRWEFSQNIAAAYDRMGETAKRDKWLEISKKYKKVTE